MASAAPASAMFYDYRVRLANGVESTMCARNREEAAALVKGILGRFGGAGARIAAITLIRKREPGLTPHVISASELRRFVSNRAEYGAGL